jgi:hypothetical protein
VAEQQPVELILVKQLAGHLALPVFLVNTHGDLLFYNEPAEQLLGRRYEETGEMPLSIWSVLFTPEDDDGNVFPADRLPLVVAVSERRPAHDRFAIIGLDRVRRRLSATAIPLIGAGDRFLGALALFWEEPGS